MDFLFADEKLLTCTGKRASVSKNDDDAPEALTCGDRDRNGSDIELKAGRKRSQNIVAVEPQDKHGGSVFSLVAVRVDMPE